MNRKMNKTKKRNSRYKNTHRAKTNKSKKTKKITRGGDGPPAVDATAQLQPQPPPADASALPQPPPVVDATALPQPPAVDATIQPQPPPADATAQPPAVDATALSQPPPADATAQPPPADATAQPPAVDATTQPPAVDATAQPPAVDATTQPPAVDATTQPPADATTQPPPADATAQPPADATAQPPAVDATAQPPPADATAQPPAVDATTQPPAVDATAQPPSVDATAQPPPADATAQPPSVDATAQPPVVDATAQPQDTSMQPPPADANTTQMIVEMMKKYGLTVSLDMFGTAATIFIGGGKGRKTRRNMRGGGVTGGKVIDTGGYGCIFNPALTCENGIHSDNYSSNLTKLMVSKNAKKEYEEIQKNQKMLSSIPNYENYFVLQDITMCKPAPLTNSDLKNYNRKCRALPKRNITRKNINKSLDKLLALQMPYAGIEVGDFLNSNKDDTGIARLNKSLIKLLNNGILRMNAKHVYHCDIKGSNVLILADPKNKNNLMARLIDWGLATTYTPGDNVPAQLRNRPLQYNSPFSLILFTSKFEELYNNLLSMHPNPEYYLLRSFVIDYVKFWIHTEGSENHFKMLQELFVIMFSHEFNIADSHENITTPSDNLYTYHYITEYLTNILFKYTHNGQINLHQYFNNVYIKNVDVWGFVMTYAPIIEYFYYNYSKLNDVELLIFEKLRNIFVHFLFETSISAIDTKELTSELSNLNVLFKECEKHESNRNKTSTTKEASSSAFSETDEEI